MAILEDNSRNLENDVLNGLRNKTVIGDLMNQVDYKSKILPYIKVIDVPGDTVKMVGLTSNKPKQFTWNYKEKEFGPSDAVVYKSELTEKDKWIFSYVFSEPIEKMAVDPDKLATAIAAQTEQVSYDIADFYDNECVQEYVCDLNRYHQNAVVKLNSDQLRDVQLVGEILITVGYQMTSPSTSFNLREERVNVRETKQLLCFIENSLYARMVVASTHQTPSPVLEVLERTFVVIPINMANDFQASLIDSKGFALAQMLHQRYLKLDEYVASHKVLDHVWRKWIFTDFRPAFALVYDNSVKNVPPIIGLTPKPKDILTDYGSLKDSKSKAMTEDEAKEWNNASFTYEQAQGWINAGLLVSDAKFADWLVNTKSKDDAGYADPLWLLKNAGNHGIKAIDDLKTESGI